MFFTILFLGKMIKIVLMIFLNVVKPHTVLESRTWYMPNSIRATSPVRKMYMNMLEAEKNIKN